jgi:hypothetical protein
MGLILTYIVMMTHLWAGRPYYGQCTHTLPEHLVENVALGLAWTTYKDDVNAPPPCTPSLTPWMLGLFDDDIMLGFDGDVGVFLPHDDLRWHGNSSTLLALWMMAHGPGNPSFTSRRLDVTTCVVL